MKHEIEYYTNGNKKFELYYNDLDRYHNENGHAYIKYYENGNKEYECYFIDGKRHNIKGPSCIWYNKDGEIEYKKYFLNNKNLNINSDEEFQKYIKRLNIS